MAIHMSDRLVIYVRSSVSWRGVSHKLSSMDHDQEFGYKCLTKTRDGVSQIKLKN